MTSGLMATARDFRQRYQAPEGLFWIRRVNHTAGAFIALLLFPTRITPNAVTVAGLAAHLVGSLVVAVLAPPASLIVALSVAFVWQLAFSLDCADGPLARARGQTSAFGAWFDQLVDSISRTAVYGSLAVFTARALALEVGAAAALGALAVGAALLQTFSSWQRVAVIGGGRPVGETDAGATRLMYAARQLVDYGAFLFLGAVLLPWPPALLVFLVFVSAVNLLFVAAQIALNYRQYRRQSGSAPR